MRKMMSVPIPVQQRYNSYSIQLLYTSPNTATRKGIVNGKGKRGILLFHENSEFYRDVFVPFGCQFISILIMITRGYAPFRHLLTNITHQASFYQTVNFFSQIEAIPGQLQKQKAINSFRSSLNESDLHQFDLLMTHINKKTKIGVTTKLVNNYYLKKTVSNPQTHPILLLELAQGGLAEMIGKGDEESQLTLYDVNLFLRYIAGVNGVGSQAVKAEKIMNVVSSISKKEGVYFLKLIDHKITIGAKEKTFNSAKAKAKLDEVAKTDIS